MPVFESTHPAAILALADGSLFSGISIGASGHTVGEVVFNTAMTGYQEIITDPSYYKQLVTLTYPHIGNTGVNTEDIEANRVYASGLIIRDLPILASNFRMTQTLPDYLKAQNVVAISGIDTRQLTRVLREKGAQNGCIMAGEINTEKAIQLAREFAGLAGMDLAKEVSSVSTYEWNQSLWQIGEGYAEASAGQFHAQFHVVAFDYGVKYNILRHLTTRGCRVTVVPAKTSAEEILKLKPDGVFLANGPGDPEPCDYAIAATQKILEEKIPLFGICLGHQLLGLACGADTLKMKFGHHGANHPVKDLESGRVMISSQNHGFAVDPKSLPANCKVTHISLFDGSLQGFMRTDVPAFCFQGHPEASPGPHDVTPLFDRFIRMMQQHKEQHAEA